MGVSGTIVATMRDGPLVRQLQSTDNLEVPRTVPNGDVAVVVSAADQNGGDVMVFDDHGKKDVQQEVLNGLGTLVRKMEEKLKSFGPTSSTTLELPAGK